VNILYNCKCFGIGQQLLTLSLVDGWYTFLGHTCIFSLGGPCFIAFMTYVSHCYCRYQEGHSAKIISQLQKKC